MRNPLRSEAEAFRFLIAVIIGALVIVGAAYINTWLGVAAAVLAVVGIGWWLKDEPVPGAGEPPPRITSATPPGTHRVLVVAAPGTRSVNVGDGATEVVVVVPALASTVESLTGSVDDRRAEAERTAAALAARIPNARGEVGADEILVAGDEEMVEAVRGRVAIPVSPA